MKRALPFTLLFLAFLVWTFPHRLLVESLLKNRLHELDVTVTTGSAGLTWPPGYGVEEVSLARDPYRLEIESVHIDLYFGGGLAFDADACGGTVRGRLKAEPRDRKVIARDGPGKRLEFLYNSIDPAACLQLGTIGLAGKFDGELRLVGLGAGRGAVGAVAENGRMILEARDGLVSGSLPSRGAAGPVPIGEWQFQRLRAELKLVRGDLIVERANARAEGVEWEVTGGRIGPAVGDTARINIELRARPVDESARAKAMLGLLPKAGTDPQGWRRYRLTGTLSTPRFIGLK